MRIVDRTWAKTYDCTNLMTMMMMMMTISSFMEERFDEFFSFNFKLRSNFKLRKRMHQSKVASA
jgi:hypothetical protein